jgi:N-acetylglucosaminyldiphosphoundecaprenol N-acetyl-beta-D-mannosaminyltransferase
MNSPDTYASVATTHRVPLGSLFADRVDFPTALDRIVARVRSGHGGYVVTPNVDHVCVAKKNEAFQRAHTNAFLSLVDGTPLTWLAKACGKPLPQKISGSDLIRPLSARAAHEGFRVAMFGASPEALAGTKQVLLAENPDLQIVSQEHPRYTPLPRSSEVDAELHEALSRLDASQPDIVFVAMGTPNQELFLAEFEDRLAPAVLCGIGAGFDFLAGLKRRAPRWAQRLGVEWLIRLLQEPGRMWRRYLVRDAAIYGIALRQIARYRFGRAGPPATPPPQGISTICNSGVR